MPEGLIGITAGEAEGVELHAGDLEPGEPAPQHGEEPVDGNMEEEPELVGTEGVVAQAIGEAANLEVGLDHNLTTKIAVRRQPPQFTAV